MKNYKVKRALAYIIDYFIISLLIALLSSVKILNPKNNEYQEAYVKYSELFNEAVNAENPSYTITPEMETLMYDISYYGMSFTIIEFAVIIIYFTFFPMAFNGQTIGKRIMKLKIVNEQEKDKVSFITYLIRSIIYPVFSTGLFYCSVTLIINTICLLFLKQGNYILINKITLIIGLMWGYTDAIVALSRQDNKSLHDILLKTKVVDINNN